MRPSTSAGSRPRTWPTTNREDDERGVIINTASIAAFEGQIGQVAYTAAKAGIAGMCLTMARDLGRLGIRVLAIAPSLFATGLTKGIPDEFADALTKDAAFPKRLGRPEEFAKLVAAIVDNPMLNGSACAWTPASGSPPSNQYTLLQIVLTGGRARWVSH